GNQPHALGHHGPGGKGQDLGGEPGHRRCHAPAVRPGANPRGPAGAGPGGLLRPPVAADGQGARLTFRRAYFWLEASAAARSSSASETALRAARNSRRCAGARTPSRRLSTLAAAGWVATS